jgi:hypothetical protein
MLVAGRLAGLSTGAHHVGVDAPAIRVSIYGPPQPKGDAERGSVSRASLNAVGA